jgi:hypothetical protein
MQFFVMTVKIRYNGRKIKVVLSHPFCVEVLRCRVQVVGMAGRGWMAADLRCMKHTFDICLQSCLVFLDCTGCKYI